MVKSELKPGEQSILDAKVTGQISLGSSSNQTLGRNKSGKLWKQGSQRSAARRFKSLIPYEQSIKRREERKKLSERSKAIRAKVFAERKEAAERKRKKDERKKINQLKSAKIEVVSKSKV